MVVNPSSQGTVEDDFPFAKVGYVSFLVVNRPAICRMSSQPGSIVSPDFWVVWVSRSPCCTWEPRRGKCWEVGWGSLDKENLHQNGTIFGMYLYKCHDVEVVFLLQKLWKGISSIFLKDWTSHVDKINSQVPGVRKKPSTVGQELIEIVEIQAVGKLGRIFFQP